MIQKLSMRQIYKLTPDLLEEIVGFFLGWRVEFDERANQDTEFPDERGYSRAFPPHSKISTGGRPGVSELHEFQVVPQYSRDPEYYDEMINGLIENGWTEISYEYFVKGKRAKKVRSVRVLIEKDDSMSPLKSNYKWAMGDGPSKELALCRAIARIYMLEKFR